MFAWADSAPLLLPPADPDFATGPVHDSLLDAFAGGQALFFRQLTELLTGVAEADVLAALWDLVWAGLVSNDTLAPVRALLAGGGAHRAKPTPGRSRYRNAPRLPASRLSRTSLASARSGPPSAAGRWYRLPERDANPTRRATAAAEALLERHGVVTRGAVMAENTTGGFAAVYPVLAALEERGSARRGYFVEGLGAAQFAVPGAVDRLRALSDSVDPAAASASARPNRATKALVLAATDPANPYGAALPWPDRLADPTEPGGAPPSASAGHRPGRKAGALVITVDGELVIYVERGGRTLLSFVEEPATLALAAKALAESVHSGALGPLSVERADGETIHSSPLGDALTTAGFRATPRGLRLRA